MYVLVASIYTILQIWYHHMSSRIDIWSLVLLSFVLVCASNQTFDSRPFRVVSFPFRSVRCIVRGSSQFSESRNRTFHFAKDTNVFTSFVQWKLWQNSGLEWLLYGVTDWQTDWQTDWHTDRHADFERIYEHTLKLSRASGYCSLTAFSGEFIQSLALGYNLWRVRKKKMQNFAY